MDAGFDALSYRNAFGSSANIEGWAKLVAEDGERSREDGFYAGSGHVKTAMGGVLLSAAA